MLWLFFPLILTPFGIIVNHDNLLAAIKNSYWITRLTLPSTSLLFLIVLVLTQGLDLLWLVPQEVSWLTILGILGHAFISTGVLAAIFIYYRDAARWTEGIKIKMKDSKKVI